MNKNSSVVQNELKNVILNETKYFLQRDFEKWASCWVQDENSTILECRPAFAEEVRGWKLISEYMQGILNEGTTELNEHVEKEEFSYQIGTDLAFVSFKENGNSSSRLLRKTNDGWKICHVRVVYTAIYEREGNYVYDWETRKNKLESTGIIKNAQ
ncbi:MAG: hypothetical protein JXB48_14865 [Candidatus Latescibacteria bacterium]|nr:hypothetical protein [Candidatus Latescibacterota bacterium]